MARFSVRPTSARVDFLFISSLMLTSVLLFCPRPSAAQTIADFNSGFTPYQEYNGGDIDSVNMATGSVNLHIPLISFPQRGSALRLTFAINYNSTTVKRQRYGTGGNTYWLWGPVDTNYASPTILDDQAYGIYFTTACEPNPPCGHGSQNIYKFYAVTGPDGAQHVMGYTLSGAPLQKTGPVALRSMDMTGFYLSIPDASLGESSNYAIYDESGIQYHGWSSESSAAGEFGYVDGSRRDANGNSITLTSSVYTDTIGRSIAAPPPVRSTNNPPPPDTAGCIGPLQVTKTVVWQVPGYNGQQYPIKFCYANITIDVEDNASGPQGGLLPDGYAEVLPVIQSIVLPDAQTLSFSSGTPTAWEFEYNDPESNSCNNTELTGPCQFGTLSKVTLPTGGSISYTYQMYGGPIGSASAETLQRAVSTRTVSDGTTSNKWTYTYTLPAYPSWVGSTVVTAPLQPYDAQANDTVYAVPETMPGHFDSVFVNRTDYYQGSHSSGSPIKSVAKSFTFYGNPYYQLNSGGQITPGLGASKAGQLLNSETTTLTTGTTSKVSQTIYAYDSGFTVNDPYFGNPCCTFYYGVSTNVSGSDYGTAGGGAGPVLRQIANTYKWQTDPPTLSANLLDLKATEIISDGSGHKCAETDYAYDTRGNPSSVARLLSSTPCTANATWAPITSYSNYNSTGELSQSTDPMGYITYYTYDPAFGGAYLTKTQMPDTGSIHHIVSANYDLNTGLQTSFTDQNTQPTTFTYDSARRITSVTFPPGAGQETFTYTDAPGSLQVLAQQQVTSTPTWVQKTVHFDGLGRTLIKQTQQAPGSTNYDTVSNTYDATGRVTSVSVPCVSTAGQPCPATPATTTTFDALGRPLLITDGGGGTTKDVYTVNDVLETAGPAPSGGQPVARQMEYDGLGRLTSVCEKTAGTGAAGCGQTSGLTGYLTRYYYDALKNLTNVTQNAQGSPQQMRGYSYDSLRRLTSESNPESGTKTYVYDSDPCGPASTGDLVKKVDAMNNVTCYGYDQLHRNTSITYPSGQYAASTPPKAFVFDASSFTCPTGANLIGRLAEAYTGPSASKITDLGYCYSPSGQTTDAYESTPHSGGYYHVPMTYWLNGLMNTFGPFLTQNQQIYTPDGEGRVGGAGGLAPTITYNAASQPTQLMTSCNGSTCYPITYTYDQNTLRMKSYSAALNGGTISGTMTWNKDGSLKTLAIVDPFNAADAQTCSYSADDIGRITSVNCTAPGGATIWSQTFSYDPFGNLTKSGSISWIPGYNQSTNQYLGGSSYDANGNLLNDTFNTYTWDADGKNLSTYYYSSSGQTWSFINDAFGHHVEVSNDNGVSGTSFLRIGKFKLSAVGQTPSYSEYPLPGGSVYGQGGGQTGFQMADWLGTIRAYYSYTGGSYSWSSAHAPFGESYSNVWGYPQGFAGEAVGDGNITNSTYWFPERHLRSSQGRWMTPDPVAGKLTDPQTFNKYSYVRNSPLQLTDPTGLYEVNASGCKGNNQAKCQAKYDKTVDRFENARQKDLNSKDPKVRAAAASYGERGGKNGVHVGFEDLHAQNIKGSVDGRSDSGKGKLIDVEVTIDSGLKGKSLQETVAHEGSHVGDDINFLTSYNFGTGKYDSGTDFNGRQTEFNGYQAGAGVSHEHGFGPNDNQKINDYITNHYDQNYLNNNYFPNNANFPQ